MPESITNKNSFLDRTKYIGFLILLYLYIYDPPFAFSPLLPLEIMTIPAVIYITIYSRWNDLLSNFKNELFVLFAIVLFCFFRELGQPENVFLKTNVFLLLQSIVVPYYVITLYSHLKGRYNLIKETVLLGVIAAFFTIILIVSPGLDDIVRYTLLRTNEFSEFITFRSFGLSEGLTFAYGTAQGLIFALIIYYSKYNPRYLWFLPFILISILFNARIGFVPVIFSLVYFVIIKFNVRFIMIFLGVGFLLYFLVFQTDLFSEYAKTLEWAFDFFTQSSDFLTGNKSSSDGNTFNTLFGEMAVLPRDLGSWIIGTGENIFISKSANSDIGYLIQLNYGGLTYLFILFSFIGVMIWRLKFLIKEYFWLILLFLFTIVLTNVKGIVIAVIPSFRLIMLIYCYLIIEYRKFDKDGDKSFNLIKFSGRS
ncbi:hypothetical protein [Pedobacter sp. UYP1]|uniref:hypothetical protein n=1 Tax=Pedobacter sp. UYP1 TaxID=1756396 RepID=UPI0033962AFB